MGSELRPGLERFLLLLVVFGAFVLYVNIVRLGMFNDDIFNSLSIQDQTLWTIFSAGPITQKVYRPLSFIPWLLIRDLYGWFVPALLHELNLVAHVLNTALVAMLAYRIGKRTRLNASVFALMAGIIFAVFPFSFQDIAWAAALPHPWMTLFGLASVHAYLTASAGNRRSHPALPRWLLLLISAGLLLGACLAHEQGFSFGLLILSLSIWRAWVKRRRPDATAVVLCGMGLVYISLYRLLLATQYTAMSVGLGEIAPKLAYFCQGLIAWLLIVLRNPIGLPPNRVEIIIAITVCAVALCLLAQGLRGTLMIPLLGLLWWVIAIAPSMLFLDFTYVQNGPRLMYLSSVGVAVFWGSMTAAAITALRKPLLQIVVLSLAVLLVAWCVPFVSDRIDAKLLMTKADRLIGNEMQATDPRSALLVINMPFTFNSANPVFLMGYEGYYLMETGFPSWQYMFAQPVIHPTQFVAHAASLTQSTLFSYGIYGTAVGDQELRNRILHSSFIYEFSFDNPGLRARRIGAIEPAPASQPLAIFTNGADRTYIVRAEAAYCDTRIALQIDWFNATRIGQRAGVFVHGIDGQGQQALVADRDLMNGVLPLDQLPAGVAVQDSRVITTTGSTPRITQLKLGVYRSADGKRYVASDSDGKPWAEDSLTIPVLPNDIHAICQQSY